MNKFFPTLCVLLITTLLAASCASASEKPGSLADPAPPTQTPEQTSLSMSEALKLVQNADEVGKFEKAVADLYVQRIAQQVQSLPPEKLQQVKEIAEEEIQRGLKNSEGEFITQFATIYAQNFTPDEIRAISNFYETSAGKKLLALSPTLIKQRGLAVGIVMQKMMPDLGPRVNARLKDIGVFLVSTPNNNNNAAQTGK